jgi:hypothetical protein
LCKDEFTHCPVFALRGDCRSNPHYMLDKCKRSCNLCGDLVARKDRIQPTSRHPPRQRQPPPQQQQQQQQYSYRYSYVTKDYIDNRNQISSHIYDVFSSSSPTTTTTTTTQSTTTLSESRQQCNYLFSQKKSMCNYYLILFQFNKKKHSC